MRRYTNISPVSAAAANHASAVSGTCSLVMTALVSNHVVLTFIGWSLNAAPVAGDHLAIECPTGTTCFNQDLAGALDAGAANLPLSHGLRFAVGQDVTVRLVGANTTNKLNVYGYQERQ